jgi:uncharacterized protein (TIGR02145 family)
MNPEDPNSLCPAPWRVPTSDDFITLDEAFGGTGKNRSDEYLNWLNARYVDRWGGVFSGRAEDKSVKMPGVYGYVWTADEYDGTRAKASMIGNYAGSGYVYVDQYFQKRIGAQVRCVK